MNPGIFREISTRRNAAIGVALTIIGAAMPAQADRHCSFAREAAFYARELSGEAEAAPPDVCSAKMTEALDRLRITKIELEICSCSYAEGPLHRWYENRPSKDALDGAGCRETAAAVNRIARTVLTEVERCF